MSFCSRADSRATVEPAWHTYWKYNFGVLGFHPNIRLKTSTYELTDRIHQNKQGFEGKKRLLLRVEEHRTRHQNGMGKRETLSLIYDKCMQPGSLHRDKLMH